MQPLCQIVPAAIPGHAPYCPYTRRPNKAGTWNAPDISKARALIAASGTKGTAITYWWQMDALGKPALVDSYMASLLRRLGYKVTLRKIRPDTVLGANFQIGSGSWWADIPSPSQWTDLLRATRSTTADRNSATAPPTAGRDGPSCYSRATPPWPTACGRVSSAGSPTRRPGSPAVQPAWISVVSSRVGGYQYVPTIGPLLHRLWVR